MSNFNTKVAEAMMHSDLSVTGMKMYIARLDIPIVCGH